MVNVRLDLAHSYSKKYFDLFAPWENEQLACIHDYLLGTIAPGLTPFNTFIMSFPTDWNSI